MDSTGGVVVPPVRAGPTDLPKSKLSVIQNAQDFV